jgi:hypothetical protein
MAVVISFHEDFPPRLSFSFVASLYTQTHMPKQGESSVPPTIPLNAALSSHTKSYLEWDQKRYKEIKVRKILSNVAANTLDK